MRNPSPYIVEYECLGDVRRVRVECDRIEQQGIHMVFNNGCEMAFTCRYDDILTIENKEEEYVKPIEDQATNVRCGSFFRRLFKCFRSE